MTQFTIEGPLLDQVPLDTVTDVSRIGDTVEVTVGNEDPISEWEFTRTTETPPEEKRHVQVITEQLYGRPALRAALAHQGKDVERIVLRARNRGGFSPGYVTFDGTTYHVERQ